MVAEAEATHEAVGVATATSTASGVGAGIAAGVASSSGSSAASAEGLDAAAIVVSARWGETFYMVITGSSLDME
jgi:hypothetical protein